MAKRTVTHPGVRRGHLIILKKVETGWLCRCDCGRQVTIPTWMISAVRTCGCRTGKPPKLGAF